MSAPLGSVDYREGALARLEDARRLRAQERWTGAVYLAGRAVEGMLRSLLWIHHREQELGHDLRRLLARTQSVGIVASEEETFREEINQIAIIWNNNLRFVGDSRFAKDLRKLGRTHRISGRRVKGDAVKANALWMLEICERIVSRGEAIWQKRRSRKR